MANFDVRGALNAGYSREEIADYLKKEGWGNEAIDGAFSAAAHTAPGVAQDDPDSLSWGQAAWEGVKNIPSSAWRLAENLGSAIANPVETARAIGDTVVGLKQKGVRALDPYDVSEPTREEQAADALIQYGKDRYGSAEGIKKTLAYDPVGMLADASTVLTGGAGALRAGGTLGKLGRAGAAAVSPAVAAEPGAIVRTMGQLNRGLSAAARAVDPLSVALKAPEYVGSGISRAAKAVGFEAPFQGGIYDAAARKLYQNALGLNTGFSNNSKGRFSPAEARAIVDAGLEEGLPVTRAGYDRAQGKISGINDRIDRAIAEADAAGVRVDPERVAGDALNSKARQDLRAQSSPEKDTRAFDRTVEEYLDSHIGDNATISGMQETKKATYKANESRFKNNAAARANGAVEADMELARQQRLEIGRAVDDAHARGLISDKDWTSIHDLNRKEGSLIELRDAMERALLKSGNRGAMDYLTGGVMAAATGDLGTGLAMGAGKQLLTSPWMRSQLALKLHNVGNLGVPTAWYTPVMGAQHFAASQPAIQDWYRQAYGGMLGELEKVRDRKK